MSERMSGRTIAIGDIHGCSAALAAIITAIHPQPDDTIVTLGDYVDRGIDSKGVLDLLIDLEGRCRLVPILGNHDEMMLHASDSDSDFQSWMGIGGGMALDSYGDTGTLDLIPAAHIEFLERCRDFFETETHFFVHANYKPNFRLEQLDGLTLRWLSLNDEQSWPHYSGKIAVVGHTPQPEILDEGHLICLDTGCGMGGWLTAFDVRSRKYWQANEAGILRT